MNKHEQFAFVFAVGLVVAALVFIVVAHGRVLVPPRQHAPDHVVINGEVWQIASVPFLPDAYGFTVHGQHLILIEENQDVEHERECLLHELMHAVGPEAPNDATYTADDFIKRTTNGLRITLRDNPEVRNFILGID